MSSAESTGPDRRALLALGVVGLAALSGCATRAPSPPSPALPAGAGITAFSSASSAALAAHWHPYVMRRDRATTSYRLVKDGTRQVLHASASSASSGLRCEVDIDPHRHGVLRFSWKAARMPGEATVAEHEYDDSPTRVILAFGGDNARLSVRDRLLFEQVELFTGHRLPFATLMYVWDGRQATGTVTMNHRTGRIRYLTVESGVARAGQWLNYRRDVVADFRRAYGEAPGRIQSVGVLTDSDALKLNLEAWYGDITLTAG